MYFSIIVPVFNSVRYIDRCIESIISQSYSDFELILVDDGSTDGSGSLCDDYAETDQRIHVIHKKNGGVSSARNAGLDTAQGEVIGFCDCDDLIEAGTLEYVHDFFQKNHDTDILFGGYNRGIEKDGKIERKPFYETSGEYSISRAIELILCDQYILGSVCNKYYKRTALSQVRFALNLTHCEDTAFNVEILSGNRSLKCCVTDRPLYCYITNENSATTDAAKIFDESDRLRYNLSMDYILENNLLNRFEKACVKRAVFRLSIENSYGINISKYKKKLLIRRMNHNLFSFIRYIYRFSFKRNVILLIKYFLVLTGLK